MTPVFIRRLYFRVFKRYRSIERRFVSYAEADKLIDSSVGKPESEQWIIDFERENENQCYGFVHMQRRVRITQ